MSLADWQWFPRSLGMFTMDNAIDETTRLRILEEHATWPAKPAKIHSVKDNVVRLDESTRSTRLLSPPEEIRNDVQNSLTRLLPQLEAHFDEELSAVERPQLLRYEVGDRFRKHRDSRSEKDGSTPSTRRVSLVVSLSDAAEYSGGGFVIFPDDMALHGRGFDVRIPAGSLLAFRADLQHEVTEVTAGERFSAVSWVR